MANNYFEFKEFKIYQDKAAMKVGTDGVLIGAWAHIDKASRILDIGTGTGLIAIMSAQRNSSSTIDALEIDSLASEQAQENINNCLWSSRINLFNISLQEYVPKEKYDAIISNPPFFINSTKTICNKKTTARHTDSLPFEEIIKFTLSYLNTNGKLSIILPVLEGEEFISLALQQKLYCTKKTIVIPKPGAQAKRLLMEFSLSFSNMDISEFTTETEERHFYTEEYKELTGAFYARLK